MEILQKNVIIIFSLCLLFLINNIYCENQKTLNDDLDSSYNVEFISRPKGSADISPIKKSDVDTSYSADKSFQTKNKKGIIISEDINEPTSLNVESYLKKVRSKKADNLNVAEQAQSSNFILLLEEMNAEQYGKHIIRVRKDGFGDFMTIQAAINSIEDASKDNNYVILVYPDVYDEKIILKDYVSLIGVDRQKCKIVSEQKWNGSSIRSGAVLSVKNSQVRNLYVENMCKDYPSVAANIMDAESIVVNCDFVSHNQKTIIMSGGRLDNCFVFSDTYNNGNSADTLSISGNPIIRNCIIETPNISGAIYIGEKSSSPNFYNCTIRVKSGGEAVRIKDDGEIKLSPHFWHCEFFGWDYLPCVFVLDEEFGKNTTIYHTGCIFSKKGERSCSYVDIKKGVDKYEELDVLGKTNLHDTYFNKKKTNNAAIRFNSENKKIEFSNSNEENWETNLYQGENNELKTDSSFSCAGLKINDKEVISSDGIFNGDLVNMINLNASNITSGTLSSKFLPKPLNQVSNIALQNNKNIYTAEQSIQTTHWKDIAVVSVAPVKQKGISLFPNSKWHITKDTKSSFLRSKRNNDKIMFAVPYEMGTVLKAIRVKFDGEHNENGIKIKLIKRNEINSDINWTIVGEEKIFRAGEINTSVLDFHEEVMEENHSYCIEITSVIKRGGIKLHSIGIQTTKRVY